MPIQVARAEPRGEARPPTTKCVSVDCLSLPSRLCATVDRCRAITQVGGFSKRWNVPPGPDVSIQAPRFHIENAHTRSEYTMNIFYIIGVVVVIILVASFLGLHA